MQVDGGRVTDYAYKPDEPATTTATNEVFVFTPGATLDRLEALARGPGGGRPRGPRQPPAAGADRATAWPGRTALEGYWRDVGTVPAYWQAHRDFLAAEPPIDLDDPAWPVHTRGGRHSAARLLPGAVVDESLVSGGTRVAGEVRGSVLSPGVVVEKGATVVDSVLLPGVRVRAGATVTRVGARRRRRDRGVGGRRRRRRHHAGRAGRAAWTPARTWPPGPGCPSPRTTDRLSASELHPHPAPVAAGVHLRPWPRPGGAGRRVAAWLTTAISASRIARSAANSAGVDGDAVRAVAVDVVGLARRAYGLSAGRLPLTRP